MRCRYTRIFLAGIALRLIAGNLCGHRFFSGVFGAFLFIDQGHADDFLAVEDELGHEFAHDRGHAEADLEAAIGDELTVVQRVCTQHRSAAFAAGANACPALDHLSSVQHGNGAGGAVDHILKRVVGAGWIVVTAFRGRADGQSSVRMGYDMDRIRKQLRQEFPGWDSAKN